MRVEYLGKDEGGGGAPFFCGPMALSGELWFDLSQLLLGGTKCEFAAVVRMSVMRSDTRTRDSSLQRFVDLQYGIVQELESVSLSSTSGEAAMRTISNRLSKLTLM